MPVVSRLSFFTLLLLISFASVNAVLYTPALPSISTYFHISDSLGQQSMTWFLIGYTLGQLLYGPIANRFGRKPAIYTGIVIQILSSFICVYSAQLESYSLLLLGRFLLALGSGVGLKMTYTMVNELYEPKDAGKMMAYMMAAFAVTPGIAISLGGILITYLSWQACFYAGAIYGLIILILVFYLPETLKVKNPDALELDHLIKAYTVQFKNSKLLAAGIMLGSATSFVYIFASLAPFFAINQMGMSPDTYGFANIFPPIGLLLGSLYAAHLSKKYTEKTTILCGIWISFFSSLVMLGLYLLKIHPFISLFLPLSFSYFGLSLLAPNTSMLVMKKAADKAHASAVMSFLNMGLATLIVLSLSLFPTEAILLPLMFIFLHGIMALMFKRV